MGGIGRKEKHLAFANWNITEGWGGFGVIDFQKHRTAVLVEPFGGGVDMVVCAGVGAANDLEGLYVRGELMGQKTNRRWGGQNIP